jgi:hypothetical protein
MKFWMWLRSNPYFVTATSALFGALLNGLYQEVQPGHQIDWSVKGWESLGATALGAVIVALYHLYTQTPAVATAKYRAQSKLGAIALIAVLLAGTMPVMATAGCSGSEVIGEINVVLSEATTVLAQAAPGSSWIAPLKAAAAELQTEEAAWESGGTVAKVDAALNTLSIVLAAIPLTAVYSPLIDVLVAGIEAVLAALPASTAPGAQKTMVTVAENPHAGRYTLVMHWYHSPAGNLKANWNGVAKAHGLQRMVIA